MCRQGSSSAPTSVHVSVPLAAIGQAQGRPRQSRRCGCLGCDEKATVLRRAVLIQFMQMRRLCGAAHEVHACIACCSGAFARNESKYIALQQLINLQETPWSIRPSKGRQHHGLRFTYSSRAQTQLPEDFQQARQLPGPLTQLLAVMTAPRRRQIESKIARSAEAST